MNGQGRYDHFLIRDKSVLVRVPSGHRDVGTRIGAEFFDVRTGVQLKAVYPSLQVGDLERGTPVSADRAEAIMTSGAHALADPSVDLAKVVSMLDIKQRRLDSVVADSILDQLGVVRDLLHDFLSVAAKANNEERFWLSQQVLSLLRKFSGRELAEIEEIVQWFERRPRRG